MTVFPSSNAATNAPLDYQVAPALHVDPTGALSPGWLFRLKWEEAVSLLGY